MNPGVEPPLALVHDALSVHEPRQDQLLPILHDVQRRCGWIPREAIPLIAAHLNVSRAEVYGVVSFYHDLRQEPPGRHVVQICVAEACQAVGCRALAAHAERALATPFGGTTADGRVTLERAYCFGNCACGPTVRIGDRVHGRVTPERFDDLLARLERTA
jgi:formate dehydrogenase subunit gamma